MSSSISRFVFPLAIALIGICLAAAGIYVGEIDDAAGAALIGSVLAVVLVSFGIQTARRRSRG